MPARIDTYLADAVFFGPPSTSRWRTAEWASARVHRRSRRLAEVMSEADFVARSWSMTSGWSAGGRCETVTVLNVWVQHRACGKPGDFATDVAVVSRHRPGDLVPYQMSLRHAMERSAREIGRPTDLATAVHAIVDVARRSMPGIDHVSVTLVGRRGCLGTMAATGQLVSNLDDLQYASAEGPCIHAIRSDPVVVVEDARREQRWPRYVSRRRPRGSALSSRAASFRRSRGNSRQPEPLLHHQ